VEINGYGRANLRKMNVLLRHSHCKHYCEICFSDQIEYIISQRKHAMAMGLHSRRGQDNLVLCLDPALIKVDGDLFLANAVNYMSLDSLLN
jgi:hypothetical protein